MYLHEFIIDKMTHHNFLHSKYGMIMQLVPFQEVVPNSPFRSKCYTK